MDLEDNKDQGMEGSKCTISIDIATGLEEVQRISLELSIANDLWEGQTEG